MKTVSIGTKFTCNGKEYLIAQVDVMKVMIIDIKDGNRFVDEKVTVSKPYHIKKSELQFTMAGSAMQRAIDSLFSVSDEEVEEKYQIEYAVMPFGYYAVLYNDEDDTPKHLKTGAHTAIGALNKFRQFKNI